MRYEIDDDECKKCANCALECPQNAIIFILGYSSVIIQEECNQCGDCIKICQHGAIEKMEKQWK
jgi:MinD superfamily P-loop ATPase